MNLVIKANFIKFSEKQIKESVAMIYKKIVAEKCESLVIRNPAQLSNSIY